MATIRCSLIAVTLALTCAVAWAMPEGLLFHASFDKMVTDADFATGDASCTLDANLDFRSAEGIIGNGLMQEPGERCTYQVPGNIDTSQGSFSIWIKPLSWEGHSKKFRHTLVIHGVDEYRMLLYLYPIGDENVTNYIQLNPKTPEEHIIRAGAPVDIFVQGEWTHLVSTWDSAEVRLYANGKRVAEGLSGAPIPKVDAGVFTVCPIEFWKHPEWSDPDERTICDEVRVFDHALTDDEALDLYASELPGGLPDLKPKLTIEMKPDYFANTVIVSLRAAHLNEAWRARIEAGAQATLALTDPNGQELLAHTGPLQAEPFVATVATWADGDYLARARIEADGETLETELALTKPPTPWLPRVTDWRADRVLEPWSPLARDGDVIGYWNGEVSLPGAFPEQISSRGEGVLAGPISLTSDGSAATWEAPRVIEEEPYRVTVQGVGALGQITVAYETLMEFDGMVRCDVTLTPPAGGAQVESLAIEIPVPAAVATWYRNPKCADWSGEALDEARFLPYGWLGNEDRGLSWFVESDANWRVGEGQPYVTLRTEGETVVARLHLMSEPTLVDRELVYTVGFEATPVRPPNPDMYAIRWAGGPQVEGSNTFVYGWAHQISYLNGRLLAHDPADQRRLVDNWRAAGKESRSYTCTQCTANISPEYRFFGEEWSQPYGSSFSGYKRVPDEEPYSMVGVCPRSSFPDFLVWCVQENLRNDWSGGIYTDIDGAKPCDNQRHDCGFTDAFGRSGRTWPLYAHRGVSRRIYAACHDAGKTYYSHAHSNWFSLFNAFNDGWLPGEQFSSAVMDNPYYYMTEMSDRVWRSEFYSPTTGVATYLLPQIGRLGDKGVKDERGPSESCYSAAMVYGAPILASLNREVVEEVWAAQIDFGMAGVSFAPFWRQEDIVCSNPEVRISLYKKAGAWLVSVANFTDEAQEFTLTVLAHPAAAFAPAWLADGLACEPGKAAMTLPARRGALIVVTDVE